MSKWLRQIALTGILVIGISSATFGVAPAAQAQTNNGQERITLSPAVLQPEFNGGQLGVGKLTILNDGATKYTFLVYARPFSVMGEEYAANYTEVNERTEAYQWIQLQQSKYTLEPGQQVEVPYTVRVPAGAAPGGHYAVIFAETQPEVNTNATGVARKKRVGALLYMTVSGEIRRGGNVESWQSQFWQSKSPVTSQLRLKNTGNVHYQADLRATYRTIFGQSKFQLNQQLLVLPGTTRRAPVEWTNAPKFGLFKAGGTVEFLGKTETLPTRYILVMPRYVPFTLLAAVIIAVIIWLIRRKRKKTKHYHSRVRRR